MAFLKVQSQVVALYSGLSAVGTSMIVTPYPKDLGGNKLTMGAVGLNPQVTVDPKIANYEEIIGFSGITDNGDGTATLTGLSRGLASSNLSVSGTGVQHGAGATVIFSLNPQDVARLMNLEDNQTVAGIKTFSSFPITPSSAPTTNYQTANKKYVDDTAVAGAPNASTTVKGIVEEATLAEIIAGTGVGSTGARLFVNPSTLISTTTAKNGTFTKVLSDANTTLVIAHGLGRTPVRVSFFAMSGSGGTVGIVKGTWDGGGQNCIVHTNTEAYLGAGMAMELSESAGVYVDGVVNVDATNINIVWTKAGAPTITYRVIWEVQ